ncbi:L,D-transpeptidase family protein [Pseudaestuariivita rosea]|uniref:L,D-transpeptidase family protein n=1 Tax=Pseudaestuariivita rosea TaxID=2763263 RepID=UPI001ABB212F|nr:murein L,D-transpeptidase family protein [Pseudaestuariivita rosea]
MKRLIFQLSVVAAVAAIAIVMLRSNDSRPPPRDINEIRARLTPDLQSSFADRDLRFGAPIFIRIFKEERELELWVDQGDTFVLFRTYPICTYSGTLGPKLQEGDLQSPEGFYLVPPSSMNPNSSYHLSFNLGFPNAYDRAADRTGSFLMVHGDCVSVGCYAMTDPVIEEIYVIAEAALNAGQPFFRVHAFPFRMTDQRMKLAHGHMWEDFWLNLKQGYDLFENTKRPPDVEVEDGRYVFEI